MLGLWEKTIESERLKPEDMMKFGDPNLRGNGINETRGKDEGIFLK